ncbi:hypothetical protein DFJ77DRAFT_206229 [Powellomyces hirtus]|nr:hypothetical protein DFJ77DRAFT_206229 [Powellomyces hirtus]
MWKKKEISVSASSVIDLKAELFKKQEAFQKEKIRTGSASMRAVSSKPIKKPPKNKGVEQRAKRDAEEAPTLNSTLEASWVALQRKSKIYDKMAREGAGGDENDEETLVDFLYKNASDDQALQQQVELVEEDDEDAWVEAVDEFGRTRIVRRSQVDNLGLRFVKGASGDAAADDNDQGDTPTLLSGDMRQEMERQEWEREAEQELATGAPGHFDSRREIRTLGTGFYQFAQDDAERARQMQELKSIRDDTLENRDKSVQAKQGREKRLDSRRQKLLQMRAAKKRKLGAEVDDDERKVERHDGDDGRDGTALVDDLLGMAGS